MKKYDIFFKTFKTVRDADKEKTMIYYKKTEKKKKKIILKGRRFTVF
jgi:hypothetical protein